MKLAISLMHIWKAIKSEDISIKECKYACGTYYTREGSRQSGASDVKHTYFNIIQVNFTDLNL